MFAETAGDPETKEELVDSEHGGGQESEPLRPSSTGVPCLHVAHLLSDDRAEAGQSENTLLLQSL